MPNRRYRRTTFLLSCLGGFMAIPVHADCTFSVPLGWSQSATRWDGGCRDGHADGLGVLKEYRDKTVSRSFFGRLKNGELEQGVIDQSDGYSAGKFANGSQQMSDDRQSHIDAFGVAETAANEAAKRFEKTGNKASAAFYIAKAKALGAEMD